MRRLRGRQRGGGARGLGGRAHRRDRGRHRGRLHRPLPGRNGRSRKLYEGTRWSHRPADVQLHADPRRCRAGSWRHPCQHGGRERDNAHANRLGHDSSRRREGNEPEHDLAARHSGRGDLRREVGPRRTTRSDAELHGTRGEPRRARRDHADVDRVRRLLPDGQHDRVHHLPRAPARRSARSDHVPRDDRLTTNYNFFCRAGERVQEFAMRDGRIDSVS